MLSEREGWKILDVKGYGGHIGLCRLYLSIIESSLIHDGERAEEYLNNLERECEAYLARFQQMDLEGLDERFPIETIRKLKTKTIPELELHYRELKKAFNDFESGQKLTAVLEGISACRRTLSEMADARNAFFNYPGYTAYRKETDESQRIGLFT